MFVLRKNICNRLVDAFCYLSLNGYTPMAYSVSGQQPLMLASNFLEA